MVLESQTAVVMLLMGLAAGLTCGAVGAYAGMKEGWRRGRAQTLEDTQDAAKMAMLDIAEARVLLGKVQRCNTIEEVHALIDRYHHTLGRPGRTIGNGIIATMDIPQGQAVRIEYQLPELGEAEHRVTAFFANKNHGFVHEYQGSGPFLYCGGGGGGSLEQAASTYQAGGGGGGSLRDNSDGDDNDTHTCVPQANWSVQLSVWIKRSKTMKKTVQCRVEKQQFSDLVLAYRLMDTLRDDEDLTHAFSAMVRQAWAELEHEILDMDLTQQQRQEAQRTLKRRDFLDGHQPKTGRRYCIFELTEAAQSLLGILRQALLAEGFVDARDKVEIGEVLLDYVTPSTQTWVKDWITDMEEKLDKAYGIRL